MGGGRLTREGGLIEGRGLNRAFTVIHSKIILLPAVFNLLIIIFFFGGGEGGGG